MSMPFAYDLILRARPDLAFDLEQLSPEISASGTVDDIAIELEIMGTGTVSAIETRTAAYQHYAQVVREYKGSLLDALEFLAQNDPNLMAWGAYVCAREAWNNVKFPRDTRGAFTLNLFESMLSESPKDRLRFEELRRTATDHAEQAAAFTERTDTELLAYESIRHAVAAVNLVFKKLNPKSALGMMFVRGAGSIYQSRGNDNYDRVLRDLNLAFADSIVGFPVQTSR